MRINPSDVFVERYGPSRNVREYPFFHSFICLSMDVFWERRQLLYLPETYTAQSVATLRQGLKDYKYSLIQNLDQEFLMSVLHFYEQHHGADSTWDLVCWIRDAGHYSARSCFDFVYDEIMKVERHESARPLPSRMERFFHIERALSDEFCKSDTEFVMTETPWDEHMVALQEYDYYGEMENLFDAGLHASGMAMNIRIKIAWENACQGNRPNQAEIDDLNEWIRSTDRYAREKDLNAFWLGPRLRTEYVRRGIVRE